MGVDSELNVTPAFTFTTIQFSNETVNTIVTALIVVFILVNIGSAVSKLVYFTRTSSFSFKSWLRAFVFANSDDPLRIVSWLSRNYVYREPKWKRYPQKRRLSRLILPILARAVIFIASIASVAITLPRDRIMEGCSNNDYKLRYNLDNADPSNPTQFATCRDIPLTTDLGEVESTAAYCFCYELVVADPFIAEGAKSRVLILPNEAAGTISTAFANSSLLAGYSFFVDWKRANASRTRTTFRSDLPSSLDMGLHERLVLDGIRSSRLVGGQPCDQVGTTFVNSTDNSRFIDLDCEFQTFEIIAEVEAYLRSAMEWERIPRGVRQSRIEITNTASVGIGSNACPLDLTVTRPIVNIVPLSIMLVIWIIINLIVSFVARKHGNALDAGFHLVKEALGHDCTSNPLEQCTEHKEVTHLELRKWRCGAGGAHVGFIGRAGDVPVEDFDEQTVVCGCSRVAVELEKASSLATAPAGFAAPGSTTISVGSVQQPQHGTWNGTSAGNSAPQYPHPAPGNLSQWSNPMPPWSDRSAGGTRDGDPSAPTPPAPPV